MTAPPPHVTLQKVDESMLAKLVEVATTETNADEVTPPLTPGQEWTPERVDWFVSYHRACRNGLDGSAREETRSIVVEGSPVGSVRLKRTDQDGVLETGIWIGRGARGTGMGNAAMAALLEWAAASGATMVRAETTPGNRAAQALMRAAGFAKTVSSEADPAVVTQVSLPSHGR